jgi:hypothetical protein
MATLILELSLTRIFSVVFYYHFAFLAISIALFGLGAGGLFSYVIAKDHDNLYKKLGPLAVLNSLMVPVSLAFVLTRSGQLGDFTLAAVYLASALPFFFSGMIVSMAVAAAVEQVDRLYFFDLAGAAAGCVALVPLLNHFGGPNTVLAASVLFAVSGAVWYRAPGIQGRGLPVLLALAFVALIAYNGTHHVIDIRSAKGRPIPKETFTQWNSFSRVSLVKSPGDTEIVIDADASTGIPTFDLHHLSDDERYLLLHQGPGIPYFVRPGAKALIIGSGGGWDIARALTSGSKDISAVEINPIIANTIMRQRFADLSHRLYFRPELRVFVADGRSFVRASAEKYQVLQETLVDTWASTAAGAFALSENNLYTVDAFRDYLDHLTDDGLMVFTRWGFEPPRESLRLVSLAIRTFRELGEAAPWKHVAVVRQDSRKLTGWGAQDTVLIFRNPIGSQDIARLNAALSDHRLQRIYLPGDAPSNEFGQLLTARDPKSFWAEYPFDVSPVTDDRPFFFYTVQPRDVWDFLKKGGQAADYKINRAVPLLFELLAVSVLATVIMLALPPLFLGERLPAEKGLRGFLIYFVCIGAGYILIQIALIQKFVLFMGHPTYALTVIIFSMLISSGFGSFFSLRVMRDRGETRLSTVLFSIALVVSVLAFVVAPISEWGVGWPLPLKVVVTVVTIAPAGFLMGMPFPTGIRQLEARFPQAVRWAWALNAAASVLGSASAIFLAIYIGLRATILIGACLYLAACSVVWLHRRKTIAPAPDAVTAAV